jgi:hypothetical protein
MHRRQRTFVELLTRSLAAAGLLYASIVVYAVPAYLLGESGGRSGSTGPDVSALNQEAVPRAWRPTHADRFPGCVDMAHWAGSEVPATVVVMRRDGEVRRMPFDEAFRRATSVSAADDVFTIGACR